MSAAFVTFGLREGKGLMRSHKLAAPAAKERHIASFILSQSFLKGVDFTSPIIVKMNSPNISRIKRFLQRKIMEVRNRGCLTLGY
jgi:hypothetical protein